MDRTKLGPNPREKASIFSILSFYWTFSLFRKGYWKILQLKDLCQPLKSDQSELLGDLLNRSWQKQVKSLKKPSLLKAIVATFWKEYLLLGVLCFACDVIIRLIQPQLLRYFLLYFEKDSNIDHASALNYATGIVLLSAINIIANNQASIIGYHNGMKVRIAVSSIIYRKVLRMSQTALGETSPGQIINLLSNDVNRFDSMSKFVHALWCSPFLVIIIGYLLWQEAQWAGLIGLAIVFIIVPIQSYSSKLSAKYRYQTAVCTDNRVRSMDEMISGIQVIKMYAWEQPFTCLIAFARHLELKIVCKNSYVRALYMTFMLFTTRMAIFCTMLAIVLLYGKENITSGKIFVISAYFNAVSFAMSQMFVRSFSEIAEGLVSFHRLQAFLDAEEKMDDNTILYVDKFKDDEKAKLTESEELPSNVAVLIRNATARWVSLPTIDLKTTEIIKKKSKALLKNGLWHIPTLENINADFPRGKLIGIIGPVGEGKSSFLQTLLRELPLESGTIQVNGTISYACQEPWVFAGTVRQNILFGQKMDRIRYDSVIKSCALETDLKQLQQGDKTIIGERGQLLSGGQKARVNLARSIYRLADVYLLDDPLSAVDAHVGRHLFNECIGPRGCLARNDATRILVTHQVHFLKDADWLIVLRNGKIEVQGSPNDLYKSGVDFAAFIHTDTENNNEEYNDQKVVKRPSRNVSKVTLRSISTLSLYNEYDEFGSQNEFDDRSMESLQVFEASSKGKIKGSILKKYFQCGGQLPELLFIFILFILAQIVSSGADYWVSFWTAQEELRVYHSKENVIFKYEQTMNNGSTNNLIKKIERFGALPIIMSTDSCIIIFAAIMFGIFVIAFTRSITFYSVCIRSSQILHDNMFKSLISTTMRFFNLNPSGRILNRFARDIGVIDEFLPRTLLDSIHTNLYMIGAITLTTIVNPLFLIPIVCLSLMFMIMRRIYLKTSKNLKRLESITRSPVFTHISVTLDGLSTIRASHAENILMDEFDNHQNIHSACWYMFISTNSAFGMILDILCLIFVFLVTFSFLLIDTGVSGDKVGLAITQAMTLTGLLQWGIRHSVEVTNQLMSVERVIEYSDLDAETETEKPTEISKSWPLEGHIEFKNVVYKYYPEAHPVLCGVSFTIKPTEKIGIVGRTGAGKSSLIGAIFRLALIQGEILIDGMNTAAIKLKDLRSRISIIPQDPVLFSGTLRMNLDPFGEYPDSEIWKAIQEVELKDNSGASIRLESDIVAHGHNFSVGQRQLICLARAILRKNKILVLDEATANVDPNTDLLIQETIRQKFAECTVLTVAHRLHTIIDSDRVLVIEAGKAVELDTPYNLLKQSSSIFKEMVFALDYHEIDRLVKIVEKRHNESANQNM